MKHFRSLAEIQSELQQAVKNTGTPSVNMALLVSEKPPLSIQERLGIYQDAYSLRLLESLSDDFTRVREKMDADEFTALCTEFITACPSRYTDIAQLSQHFSEFLVPKSTQLSELAAMDWLEILAARAADPAPEDVVPVNELEKTPDFLVKKYPATQVSKVQDSYYMASRNSHRTEVSKCEEKDFNLLSFLQEAKDLEQLAGYAEQLQLGAEALQQKFSQWIQNEIIYCERRKNV